jgi:hypothetical protein
MTLADLGADVIKVEDARRGDDTRAWGPPFQGGEGVYFLSVNRNKRSLAVDLKNPTYRDAVCRLAADADIVVENFRPGTAARLGLGYVQVAETNPAVVFASISGYGQTDPLREEPGYDAIAQAVSGIMSITGQPDGPPARFGVSGADIAAGMWATVGILAALWHSTGSASGSTSRWSTPRERYRLPAVGSHLIRSRSRSSLPLLGCPVGARSPLRPMLDSLTDAGNRRAGHAIAKAGYLVGDRAALHAELWIAKGLYGAAERDQRLRAGSTGSLPSTTGRAA